MPLLVLWIFYSNYTSNLKTTNGSIMPIQLEKFVPVDLYIQQFIEELNNNYRVGNNKVIVGREKTDIRTNSYGDVLFVSLSNEIFVAKGYFEKMIDNLSQMVIEDKKFDVIREKLIRAAKTRIEAIELYSKGQYLKEQRGKIRVASMTNGTSAASLPEYHGEVENSLARLIIADSYIVDALNEIHLILKEKSVVNEWDRFLASEIAYYSDVSESDYESYLRSGELSFNTQDYFNAYIDFYKAAKIKPNEKVVLIGQIKSALGLGDKESAIEKYESALKIYPNENDLKQFSESLKTEESKHSQK